MRFSIFFLLGVGACVADPAPRTPTAHVSVPDEEIVVLHLPSEG
jgi:hypothetical protein